ncbi:MAG: M48 family metalloprotease [Pseudomonadota bacterium]|nr:M48 family metalloprotease [Pseudomonadota bacterium]
MRILITFVILGFFSTLKANSLNIIRDAEIENLFNDLGKILVKDTSLEGQKLSFFIDNKNYINALVTPDKKFFFTTELLLKSKGVNDLAGVISHEIGHIIGGHFQKRQEAMKKTSAISILSSILAIGAIAGGATDAGTALLMGGQHISRAKLLAFSRSQESIADQTAIRLLKKNGFSLQGLINVFQQIQRNERLKKVNPYFLTHPLSNERIKNIKKNLDNQKITKYKDLEHRFSLAKAKLNGFFLKTEQIDRIYPQKNSLETTYAYALNSYKIGKVNQAIELVNRCIEIDSENPYFYELKGQMYFEKGDFHQAVESFKTSNSLLPEEKAFKLFLAKSLYHSGYKVNQKRSIDLLWSYIKKDEFPIDAWHYLGLNYGKLKKLDYSSYAFAEKYLLIEKFENAKTHIKKAKNITKDAVLLKKLSDLEHELKKKSDL